MNALLFSLLLLFAASAVAQSQPASISNGAAQTAAIGGAPSAAVSPPQQNLCYTMRSYMFERNDGSSSLAGSKTCTPANRFRAIYIPTVINDPHAEQVVRRCSPSGCTSIEPEKQPKR